MVRQSLSARFPWVLAIAMVLLLNACTTQPLPGGLAALPDRPPPIPREFRAAWVATVANIDWPSRKDLTVAEQKAEMLVILDRASELKLNAIILQVRTSADALYASPLEPWSEYLTGAQGRPPQPFYDPLTLWIEAAHARGIELHAWFNPYRARHTQAKSPPAATHIANTQPQAVKSYGGYLWMDPGEPAASQQTLDVILDVVRRYDIDGVHIDDYFYPYPVNSPLPPGAAQGAVAAEIDFPDDPAWVRYLNSGGNLSRADWRRQNVNVLIEKIYDGIKREKRWVKFGVSPFGLGKPDQRPPGIAGFSQYDKLYADVELWLQRGWMDYLVPQLYWRIDQPAQAFPVLLDYWLAQNSAKRHVWPGLYTSRIMDSANPNPGDNARSWEPAEILAQIALARERAVANPLARGQVHFSMVALTQNRKGVGDQLKAAAYGSPVLTPAMPWLDATAPARPLTESALAADRRTIDVRLVAGDGQPLRQFALWLRYGNQWRFEVVPVVSGRQPTQASLATDAAGGPLTAVSIVAVDYFGNESAPASIDFGPRGARGRP